MACTPHVQPGRYPNCAETILPAIRSLQAVLRQRGIPLTLVGLPELRALLVDRSQPIRARR